MRHAPLLLLLALPVFSAIPSFPQGAAANLIRVDHAGNGYVAGLLTLSSTNSSYSAFVAKYRLADGQIVYYRKIATTDPATSYASVNAITVDNSGALYATGTGASSILVDETPFKAITPIGSTDGSAFALKIGPTGDLIYASQFGAKGVGNDIAVNDAGEAYITGGNTLASAFPATPGAAVNVENNRFFVAKLNAAGDKTLLVERGIGGSKIALDAVGNIYVAGLEEQPPITTGAFQRTHEFRMCASIGFFGGIACFHQHVAKLDPTGSTLLYSTFLTGDFGSIPNALAVDGEGNAIVAGTTNSENFPTTSGALVPAYRATNAPTTPAFVGKVPPLVIPASAGFVAKLNSTGTGLIFSTYFSGTRTDQIDSMEYRNGRIYIAGTIGSADLPGTTTVAQQCLPMQFVTALIGDARGTLGTTRVLPLGGFHSIAIDPAGIVYTPFLDPIDLNTYVPVHCLTDAASLRILTSVSPGQVVSLFALPLTRRGPEIGEGNPLPTRLGNLQVLFDGIAAPLLYASALQANLVVPYELAGKSEVTMEFSATDRFFSSQGSQRLTVKPSSLAAFEAWDPVDYCGRSDSALLHPVAFAHNADGSVNTCKNPAEQGSVLTLFINGGGVAGPNPLSGAIAATANPVNVTATATSFNQPLEVVRLSLDPGSVNSVWRLELRMPQRAGPIEITPRIGGVALCQGSVAVWLK